MFSGKSRHVPSKAALNALYQLAYISSGTAVGVAALCAEERRRRTQVVQRIADNAKRLRQSPRYYQNAAVALEAEEESFGPGAFEWVPEYRGPDQHVRDRKTRAGRQQRVDSSAARGPELPSVVESEYGKTQTVVDDAPMPRYRTRRSQASATVSHTSPGHDDANSSDSASRRRAQVVMQERPWLTPHPAHPAHSNIKQPAFARFSAVQRDHGERERREPYAQAPNAAEARTLPDSESTMRKQAQSRLATRSRIPYRMSQEGDLASIDTEANSSSMPSTGRDEAMRSILTRREKSARLRNDCGTLIAQGQIQEAADLLAAFHAHNSMLVAISSAFRSTIRSALESGFLSASLKLIRIAEDVAPESELVEYCDSFLRLCDQHKAYGTIVQLVGPSATLPRTRACIRSDKANEIVAFACSEAIPRVAQQDAGTLNACFQEHYNKVPLAMRARSIESRTCVRLRRRWHSTHNISRIGAQAVKMREWLTLHGDDESRSRFEQTVLDIFVSANGKWSQRLFKKPLEEANSDELRHLSVLCAKRRAWPALGHLLARMQDYKPLANDADTTRRFNNIVHLYARHHPSPEIWKFVTATTETLGFVPNQTTTEIVLAAFASKGSILLIAKWLRHVRVVGHPARLDTRLAARLLTQYYLKYRPSHVMVMWFCRNLIHAAPSLAGPEFIDLIKEAIGFDMRKATGGNATLIRSMAQKRLDMLEGAGNDMPSPGWRWGGQIHLVHPSAPLPMTFTRAKQDASGHSCNSAAVCVPSQLDSVETQETTFEALYSSHEDVSKASSPKDNTSESTSPALGQAQSTDDTESMQSEKVMFDELRSIYDLASTDNGNTSIGTNQSSELVDDQSPIFATTPKGGDIVRDMVLALSLKQCDKVIQLYKQTLSAERIPISPLALEITVEASLRLRKGNSSEAESILRDAKAAGMNVSCALGPLLIHRMYRLTGRKKRDCEKLRISVIDYYRMNEENGWPVKHHVGVTAANILIDAGAPEYGINILDAIYRSEWAIERPFDIAAMTVFLKGYGKIKSKAGILWVIQTVLESNMRVDQKFLHTLKAVAKDFLGDLVSVEKVDRMRWRRLLISMIQRCYERRAQQMFEAKTIGKKLVAVVARYVNEQPVIDVRTRGELEDELFGQREKAHSPSSTDSDGALALDDLPASPQRKPRYLERLKRRVVKSVRGRRPEERVPRSRTLRRYDMRWLREYRMFLRHDLVMPDGRLASFRYRLADEPGRTKASKQRRRVAARGVASW